MFAHSDTDRPRGEDRVRFGSCILTREPVPAQQDLQPIHRPLTAPPKYYPPPPSLLNIPQLSSTVCIPRSLPHCTIHNPRRHTTMSTNPQTPARTAAPAPAPAPTQPKRESDSSLAYEQAEIKRAEALNRNPPPPPAPKGALGSGDDIELKPWGDKAGLGSDDEYVFV